MDYTSMEKLALFRGLTAPEIRQVCDCFGTHVKTFTKGDIIFKKGAAHTHFGVVFDTRPNECEFLAHIKSEDSKTHPKTITATEKTTVLFVPFRNISRQCKKACRAHRHVSDAFIAQLMNTASRLEKHVDCLAQPSVRQKVMTFLRQQQQQNCESSKEFTRSFEIKGGRRDIAQHLNVEYTALSRELSNLKKDKVLDFDKNVFRILQNI